MYVFICMRSVAREFIVIGGVGLELIEITTSLPCALRRLQVES